MKPNLLGLALQQRQEKERMRQQQGLPPQTPAQVSSPAAAASSQQQLPAGRARHWLLCVCRCISGGGGQEPDGWRAGPRQDPLGPPAGCQDQSSQPRTRAQRVRLSPCPSGTACRLPVAALACFLRLPPPPWAQLVVVFSAGPTHATRAPTAA